MRGKHKNISMQKIRRGSTKFQLVCYCYCYKNKNKEERRNSLYLFAPFRLVKCYKTIYKNG